MDRPLPRLPVHDEDLKQQNRLSKLSRLSRMSRLSRLAFIPNKVRNEAIAAVAEFCGTFMFLFMAFAATQVGNAAASSHSSGESSGSLDQSPDTETLVYISLAFGFSLAVNAWIFFRVSGGLFNPAVTLGLYMIGSINLTRAISCFLAQLLGAICAAGVVSAILPGALDVSTSLGGGTSISQGLFLEMFLTAELVFTIFMLAAEKHKGTYLAPVGIGLSLFVCEMTGVYFTGGSLNPARSFGPAVATRYFPDYHWIYWFGPFLGTLLAVGLYKLLKYGEYETVNPGQDFDDQEAQLFDAPANPIKATDVERPNLTSTETEKIISETIDRMMRNMLPHEETRVKQEPLDV